MSMGKGGSTTYQVPTMTPEQQAQIKAQTEFFTGTIKPTYEQTVAGATNLYNAEQPGVMTAAQNLAGTAAQAKDVLGSTGESAVKTGISGLQNLFNPDYEAQQLAAVMNPAQAQYTQNIQNLQNQFGGAGQIGSARQALANTQLAGQTQASQQAAAAQVENQIAQQRLAAAQALTGAGQAGIGQAIGAAQQGITAAMTPQQLYNQYASVLYGAPQGSWNPNFAGTQAMSTQQNTSKFGISI